mmetsp:Transcript_129384/g.258310  ORF Transcript_129384/g.258310 Transcript_129384/m.258310 type:complete len:174 (+) Transcript_129384:89-610(+)|eukprot:CAMPEP_0172869666 /NCGR_PEP_ID=MMETSP1075-20121228/89678_1 /TAXON_ID=2916 /ORGANISM="Ceratium fusus, Strain PA161109" /LENGTH=173 /DNA_ID=CAMNT_0013719615 /DNA_START=60 /DNA_END=581 /DNA_ORIENTATION=+
MASSSSSKGTNSGPSPFSQGELPPLQDFIGDLLSGKHAYTSSFWDDVQAFVHAIDWRNDQWIFAVFGMEFLFFVFAVVNRNRWERLSALFVLNSIVLFGAERLNGLAAKHWKDFASQQYFDPSGTFASVVLGVPLLVCQLLIVVFLLREAASMVIKVKRLEFKRDIAQKKKQQ